MPNATRETVFQAIPPRLVLQDARRFSHGPEHRGFCKNLNQSIASAVSTAHRLTAPDIGSRRHYQYYPTGTKTDSSHRWSSNKIAPSRPANTRRRASCHTKQGTSSYQATKLKVDLHRRTAMSQQQQKKKRQKKYLKQPLYSSSHTSP